ENELAKMETELGEMQQELAQVQREREILEGQRRVLKAVAPTSAQSDTTPTCTPAVRGPWRNDHLLRLLEDLEAKVAENCELRTQVERLREGLEATQLGLENSEARAIELEQKLRALESQRHKLRKEGEWKLFTPEVAGSREAALEQQQALGALRQQYDEAQDELEEMRALIEDQAGHLEGYRNKYLAAQQQVEEQRRKLEQVEAEQDRITDQVQAELHRVKDEFEERLQELAPLPDILKATQAKMQEEKQLRMMAEHNCTDLNHGLATALERLADNEKEMNFLRAQQQSWVDERQSLLSQVEAYERKCNKLKDELKWYKQGMEQLEQANANSDKLYEDTVLELGKVRGELDAAREQAARQAARQREQMDTIQQRLQTEVSNMRESFRQAQERITGLQSVVNILRNNVLNIDKPISDLQSKN
ncbi:Outer dense fiber protein 2, partial [Frankliniella fusca]